MRMRPNEKNGPKVQKASLTCDGLHRYSQQSSRNVLPDTVLYCTSSRWNHHRSSDKPMRRRGLITSRSLKDTTTIIHKLPSDTSKTASNGNMSLQLDAPSSLRNQLSFFISSAGVLLYCVLLASNAYSIWAYPILIAATACWLLSEESPRIKTMPSRPSQIVHSLCQGLNRCKCRSLSRILINDINHSLVLLTSVIVALPCTIFVVKKIAGHMATKTGTDLHEEIAMDFGKLGVAGMSYFLIPISKHSILLEAAGIGSVHAVRLHIWAGCIAIFGGLTHGLYYIWIWIFLYDDTLEETFPLDGECWVKGYPKSCHTRFVNLSGIMCGTSFVVLGLTSVWWVRRNFYRLFYFFHVTFSLILLFGLTMHYNKMVLYLAPSLLYYMASNVPFCMEAIQEWYQGGNAISKVVHIPDSGGCVELSLRMPGQNDAPCGKYIRLCVPEISFKSHPFTVFSHPDHPGDVKLMFRTCGAFTSQLSTRLTQTTVSTELQYPKILVNGLHAGANQLDQALRHDTIIIFAGGVGIVSYISLLSSLLSLCRSTSEELDLEGGEAANRRSGIQKKKLVYLHWACRDQGLIEYIMHTYLVPLQNCAECDFSPLAITFTAHHTGRDSASQEQQNGHVAVSETNLIESAAPVSSAFLRDKKMLCNLLPTTTFAIIAWGGLWIIKYCYDNIQSKHVMETRPIAVFALILWSVVVSLVSLFAVSIGSSVRSKFFYTKLDISMEIECPEIIKGRCNDDAPTPSTKTNLQKELPHSTGPNDTLNETLRMFHSLGRPNVASIIQGALNERVNNGSRNDVGIFMCGPTSLSDSVRIHCHGVEGGGTLCTSMRTANLRAPLVLYEEVYEL
jgi:predicted ferric reductase